MSETFSQVQEHSIEMADYLKSIAHPDRLMVLCLLSQGEQNVASLAQHTQLSQSAFSQQLRVLKDQKLVRVRKQSQKVYYSLADQRVHSLLKTFKDNFCKELN